MAAERFPQWQHACHDTPIVVLKRFSFVAALAMRMGIFEQQMLTDEKWRTVLHRQMLPVTEFQQDHLSSTKKYGTLCNRNRFTHQVGQNKLIDQPILWMVTAQFC